MTTEINIRNIPAGHGLAVIEWCFDHWGAAGDRWRLEDLNRIVINRDSDATLLILKWGV